MAAVMDLDLNCSPPSPEPAAREDLKRAMLRQEHTFRDQVKDLHRLYWTQRDLTDGPFWKQSGAWHSADGSLMIDLDDGENQVVFSDSDEPGKQAGSYGDEATEENLDVKGSIWRNPDAGGVQEDRGYRNVIDLEKPATLDDEVEILSASGFGNLANNNGGFWDHCTPRENCSPLMHDQLCRDHNIRYGSSGSIGSSDTPDSHSPVKPKTPAPGHMLIDLNIAQEDDFHVSPDPPKVFGTPLVSSSMVHPGDFCNTSNKIFYKECESSIGSSKGSSITVVKSVSASDSLREVTAAGLFHDPQNCQPFCVEASEHCTLRENTQHHREVDKVCRLSSQGCKTLGWVGFSVNYDNGNDSSSGLQKLGDNHIASPMGQPAIVAQREPREETLTVISDDEEGGIDLNVSVGSTDLPSKIASGEKRVNNDGSEETLSGHYLTQNESRQTIPSVECPECPITRDHHMAESKDCKKSPDSGTTNNRSVLIPETPQGRDYACPRLRSSNNGASNPLDAVSTCQAEMEEDDKIAATAAETLLSIFADNSAWIAHSVGSNSQAEARDGNDVPQYSLDSFEESILNLEEINDDGESVSVRPPDKDGPSCGIKLKRGRGLRDFQREILPGLVSLARHEICDDLHAIGYELRKTRSRRTSGDQWPPSTRTRLPRRCSITWNQ